jgi:hypothetical protein
MRAIRFKTALELSLTGVLLMGTQFMLLTHRSLTHPGVAGTELTSAGTEGSGAAGCHEESAPQGQAPQNHDCCTVGHLHAIASAQLIIAPAFAVTPLKGSILLSGSIDQTSSQTSQVSDTGPPGSAVPIRV